MCPLFLKRLLCRVSSKFLYSLHSGTNVNSWGFNLITLLPRHFMAPLLLLLCQLLSRVPVFETQWTVACQVPLSMEFWRQEYWSGLPFPSPGELPNPGIKPWLPKEYFHNWKSFHHWIAVYLLSHIQLVATPWTAPGFPVLCRLLQLAQVHVHESVRPSNHLILCLPFSSRLQSFPASGSFPMSQLFGSGGQRLSISSSSEYSGLISFRMDRLDLFAVQGSLKSLLQHHSSKHSIL